MSYEIELKAHVYNREQVIQCLNKAGTYVGSIHKTDRYFRLPKSCASGSGEKPYVSCRFRFEEHCRNNVKTSETVFTYKQKELLVRPDGGAPLEVNDEKESVVENAEAIIACLKAAGAKEGLVKEKLVEEWNVPSAAENAHAELCTVPPLGDFLEIEIIKEEQSAATVEAAEKAIKELFTRCSIPLEQIEPRYYSDMLLSADK